MGDCSTKTNNENPSVELFMTVIVNIGNVLSIAYNIPQMWRTHKLKKADDISSHFLWMRLSAGIIWSIYCIYYKMWYVIISWTTTIISTTQILYYKYYPSPSLLEPIPLVEIQQQQQQQNNEQYYQKNEEEEATRKESKLNSKQKKEYSCYVDTTIALN